MTEYVHTISKEETEKIARFLRWLAVGIVLFVLLIVILFITADRWLRLISIESERRFIEPYIGWLSDHDLIDADPALQSYVGDLTDEISGFLEHDGKTAIQLRVHVIEGDAVNAFATLGGYIFVFEGLIHAMDNENSLAMVLAHEIAHVHHRDPVLGLGRSMLIQLAISTLSGNGIDPDAVNMSGDVILNQYSRDQELAADELALHLLHQRYGHVGGAKQLFEIIGDDPNATEAGGFLSTHPDTDVRIERIAMLTARNGWTVDEPLPYPDAVRSVLDN